MKRTETITLDVDWLYRSLGKSVVGAVTTLTSNALMGVETAVRKWIGALIAFVFRHHGPEGVLARSSQAGSMVMWVLVLLATYLVLYFV